MSVIDALFELAPNLRDSAKVSTARAMICCPFHDERGPSCSVSLEAPVFCCFGCGESGHISKLFKHLGLDRSSIDIILKSSGFDPNSPQAHEARLIKAKGKIGAKVELTGMDPFKPEYVLEEAILDTYRLAPTMLLRAGFTKATLRHFEVGFDTTNSRITFPLRSRYGELVGVSGRTIYDGLDGPRYKIYDRELTDRTDFNVPATYTMDSVKQTILWHAHIVLPLLMQDSSVVVIVEGFKQTMAVYQAEVPFVVGLVGSALTDYHTELLSRYAQHVILFLDNNTAGWIATHQAATKLAWRGIQADVASYPDDRKQPDDLTPDEIVAALDDCKPYNDWKTRYAEYDQTRLSKLLAPRAGHRQRPA